MAPGSRTGMTANESLLATRRLMAAAHLFVLSRAHARGSDEHGTGVAPAETFFETLLPGLAGHELPAIEPWMNSGLPQPVRQHLHCWSALLCERKTSAVVFGQYTGLPIYGIRECYAAGGHPGFHATL